MYIYTFIYCLFNLLIKTFYYNSTTSNPRLPLLLRDHEHSISAIFFQKMPLYFGPVFGPLFHSPQLRGIRWCIFSNN